MTVCFFFNQVNSTERVLPDDEFWAKFILQFLNIRKDTNLMVKPLQNVTFWKIGYPNIFFWKYVPLVVSKPYTKFQQLLLLKTAILERP